MTLVSLALWACFILLTLFHNWLQRRRTADTGFRISRQIRTGPWWVSAILLAGGVLSLAAPVAELFGLPPLRLLDHLPLRIAGAVVAGLGMLAVLGAQLAMGASWRVGVDEAERTTLVTDGPFRLVRNPIFTAVLVTVAGLAVTMPNLVAMAGLSGLVLAFELQVRLVEEPHLRRVHGDAYERYAKAVGRFLPGIGHLTPGGPT